MNPKWLVDVKSKAKELVDKVPYQQIRDSPSVKYYTDWTRFDKCLDPAQQHVTSNVGVTKYQLPPASLLSINGSISTSRIPSNVNAWELSELGEDKGSLVLRSMDPSESKALARHVANLVGGGYVEVLRSPNEPLRIINIARLEDGVLIPTHYTVVVNDDTELTLILYMISEPGSNACPSTTMELYLGSNSTLNLVVASSQEASPSYAYIKVMAGENSTVNAWTLLLNGSMNHHREDYVLNGRGARVRHEGLEIGLGTSRIDYIVNLMHVGESSTSYSRVTGVSKDKSFVIHRGLGRITEKARWSDTTVEGKVFILNEGSYAASVPIIMVDTGDVNGARHSAADASLDEDQVNYLRLRGISRDEVIPLIIHEVTSRFLGSIPSVLRDDAQFLRDLITSKIIT